MPNYAHSPFPPQLPCPYFRVRGKSARLEPLTPPPISYIRHQLATTGQPSTPCLYQNFCSRVPKVTGTRTRNTSPSLVESQQNRDSGVVTPSPSPPPPSPAKHLSYLECPVRLKHRRRINTEEKANVVAAVWGQNFSIPCRASYFA